ncbi:MAG: oligosaccharide flippase family protein [Actinomycetota bacterium]|nr:oligosaccharide flippase family protein [Actinomycetota bacterium]
MTEERPDSPQVSVARGTFLGVRADVVTAISLVVVSVVLARALGPANRGIFFLGALVAAYAAIIGDLGMSTAGVVYAANRRIALGHLHGVAVGFSVVAGAVAAVALLPFEGFWTDTVLKGLDTTVLILVCVGIPPLLYAQIMVAVLTGTGRVPATATLRTAQAIALPLLLTPVAVATGSPAWSLGAWLVTSVGYAAAIATYTVRQVTGPTLPSGETIRTMASFGTRGYIGTLSHHGFLRIDVFFLSARFGPAVVGLYSLASVVAERISLIGQAVYAASANRVGSAPLQEAAALTAQTVRLLLLVMTPAAALMAVLSWPVFPLAFGRDFADAALPFTLLLPGTVCLTVWHVTSLFIVSALRRPGTTTLIQGGALLVSLPLYYLAVREASMTGAAIVSSVVYASVLAMGLAVFVRNSPVSPRELLPHRGDLSEAVAALRGSMEGRPRA